MKYQRALKVRMSFYVCLLGGRQKLSDVKDERQ